MISYLLIFHVSASAIIHQDFIEKSLKNYIPELELLSISTQNDMYVMFIKSIERNEELINMLLLMIGFEAKFMRGLELD